MSRYAPILWIAIVIASTVYLWARISGGVELQTNILALLPRAERDATTQEAQDRIAASFSRRVILLVGARDPAKAHLVVHDIVTALQISGLASTVIASLDDEAERRLATAYFPFRLGLLSRGDREALLANDGNLIEQRALAFAYGPGGIADGRLLARVPFMLMPSFFAGLPLPEARMKIEDGMLSVVSDGITFSVITAEVSGDPYSTRFQDQFVRFIDVQIQKYAHDDLHVLRAGAIFYAYEGAAAAASETTWMGTFSILGTIILVVSVFRRIRPLLLSLLAIGVGILAALAGTLWWYGELHAVAMLFGVSLIGISVDYSLQYFCEYFDPEAASPRDRLARVRAGIVLGLATTLIGYITFLAAPFPGLQQIAVFSVLGLSASFLTVLIVYPTLDAGGSVDHGTSLIGLGAWHWALWESRRLRVGRRLLILVCLLVAAVGLTHLRVDDDVRHMQSLSATLRAEEQTIERLTGANGMGQFILIEGPDEQAVLQDEEALFAKLEVAKQGAVLESFQSMAQYVPSIARQKENRGLVESRLYAPYLNSYQEQLGFTTQPDLGQDAPFLTPAQLPTDGPLALIKSLEIATSGPAMHLVLINGLNGTDALRRLLAGSGARLLSPADDYSQLFAKYRRYAVGLLVVSALLMLPPLIWRYGFGSAIKVMIPPLGAIALAPPIAALFGVSFTFFNAMALVLVLSISVDYSVFCRETEGRRKPVTAVAIALAAISTNLSFGLLAFSSVFAVHSFGVTTLIGITLAYIFAPSVGDATQGRRHVWWTREA